MRNQNIHCKVINAIESVRFNSIFPFVNSIFIFYKNCYKSVLSCHFGNQNDIFILKYNYLIAINSGENL